MAWLQAPHTRYRIHNATNGNFLAYLDAPSGEEIYRMNWSNNNDYAAHMYGSSGNERMHVRKISSQGKVHIGDGWDPDLWVGPVVSADPKLSLNPTSLSFSATEGGGTPSSKTVSVTNSGDGTLNTVSTQVTYGSASDMRVGGGSSTRGAYIRFVVSGLTGTVTEATLLLCCMNQSTESGGDIHLISDNSWDESTLSWSNRPSVDGGVLDTLRPVSYDQAYELDVTAAVTGNGTYSFAIDTTAADGCGYYTKEHGVAAERPAGRVVGIHPSTDGGLLRARGAATPCCMRDSVNGSQHGAAVVVTTSPTAHVVRLPPLRAGRRTMAVGRSDGEIDCTRRAAPRVILVERRRDACATSCDRAMRSKLERIEKSVGTLRRHEVLLMNWLKANEEHSCGAVESLNRKANLTTREPCGFRSLKVLTIALYQTMGQLPEPYVAYAF